MKKVRLFIRSIFICPKKHDKNLSWALLILLGFSSIMVVSATMSTSGSSIGSSLSEILSNLNKLGVIAEAWKQVCILILCYIAYHFLSNYFSLEKYNIFIRLFAVGIFILLIVASTISNNTVSNGWIYIFGISLQPSEFAKVAIILLIALILCDKRSKQIKTSSLLIKPMIFYIGSVIIILVLQNDMGSAFCFAGVGAITFLMVNDKRFDACQKWLLGIIIFIFVCFGILMIPAVTNKLIDKGILAYQLTRIKSVLDPTWDRYGYSRELLNSLIAIMKGNILGVGIGDSVLKFGYIASSNADYIFAIIVEETGLIGITIIFGCYAIILYSLIKASFKAKKNAEKAILIGTVSYLFVHMFLNVGGVSGLIPSTGVPLLLVSAGGSSMLSIMALLGICQRIIANLDEA